LKRLSRGNAVGANAPEETMTETILLPGRFNRVRTARSLDQGNRGLKAGASAAGRVLYVFSL
jgi:hypothetical protein